MKTQATPDTLFIDDNPKILAGALVVFLLVFWAIGISASLSMLSLVLWLGLSTAIIGSLLHALARRIQIVLDRKENSVTLRTSTLLRATTIDFKLEHLAKAEVQTMVNDKGDELGRAVLVFDGGMQEGPWPLTPHYSSKGPWVAMVSAINGWLAQDGGPDARNGVDSQPPQA